MVNQGRTNLVRWGRNFLSQGGTYDDRDQARLEDVGSLSNAERTIPNRPTPVEITPPQRWQDRIDLIPGWDRLFGSEQDDRAVALELPDVGATVVEGVAIPMPDVRATVRDTSAQVRPPARTQVRPRSDEEELALLDPRHAVAMLERRQLRAQGALAEMAMGPGAVSGSARLTNQPGTPYGEEIAGVMGHRHVGERHQGVDVVIGEAGRPDPIYNRSKARPSWVQGGARRVATT